MTLSARPKGRPSLHHYEGKTVLLPPTSRMEAVVQPLTPEEHDCASIQEPGLTYSLQLSTLPHAPETITPCQPDSEPILAPGPCFELMPKAWPDYALQPEVYSWDTMHARYQVTNSSISMFNTSMNMQHEFHDAMGDLCVPELQVGWHLETRGNLSQVGQLPLCSFKNAMEILGQLTPRVQALDNKSQEVFKNWGPSHKQGDFDQRLPMLLLNDAVLKLVMAWLNKPSEDMNDERSILNSLSSATNELRNDQVVVELLSCSAKLTKATQSLHEELGVRTNKAVCDNIVAQHLVVVCHMQLLSSFVAVLGALQEGAEVIQGNTTPGLADLRLAMVVQLSSYLFVRQCRVVDGYLEVESGPKSSAGYPNQRTEDGRVIQELMAGVHSRLAWFQSFWYGPT
ncbi:unnamed protein product [Fusarium fujikuroi]|nr:hypothetical protein CEK25_002777 [Fusarium fujikuroi]VZI12886.1 unnamed protein product [Fusarium fujikuroi]